MSGILRVFETARLRLRDFLLQLDTDSMVMRYLHEGIFRQRSPGGRQPGGRNGLLSGLFLNATLHLLRWRDPETDASCRCVIKIISARQDVSPGIDAIADAPCDL